MPGFIQVYYDILHSTVVLIRYIEIHLKSKECALFSLSFLTDNWKLLTIDGKRLSIH